LDLRERLHWKGAIQLQHQFRLRCVVGALWLCEASTMQNPRRCTVPGRLFQLPGSWTWWKLHREL